MPIFVLKLTLLHKRDFFLKLGFKTLPFLFTFTIPLNLLVNIPAFSQEVGKPFIKYYSPKEYKAHIQNWDIAEDKQGLIYIANGDGILEYDGVNFRLIPLPQKKVARSLAIDSLGVIYYGTSGDFGYLFPNNEGKLVAHSLSQLLNEEDKSFGNVWEIIINDDAVYFRTYNKLFRYENGHIKSWSFKNNTSVQFLLGNKLYVNENKVGIKVLEADTFRLVRDITKMKKNRLSLTMPYDSISKILGTRYSKLEIYSPITGFTNEISTDVDDLLSKVRLYSACAINKNAYALGTDGAGLYIINRSGELLQEINEKTGLQNQSVLNVKADTHKNIWIALNNGISRVEISSPISYWDKTMGLAETPDAILKFQDKIYIGTQGGIYCLKGNKLKKISDFDRQCWSLLDFQEPNDTSRHHLLVGTSEGIYEIKENQLIKVYGNSAVFELITSKKDPNRIFVGKSKGLTSLLFKNGQWIHEESYEGIKYNIRGILEDENGIIWLGSFRNGVIKVSLTDTIYKPKLKFYKKESGLPSLKNVLVYEFNNRPIFGTEEGLYKYDEKNDRFVPDSSLGVQFCNGSRDVFSFIQTKKGNIWISGLQSTTGEIGFASKSGSVYEWYSTAFKIIPEMMVLAFYVEEDGKAWIGGSEGLFRYDPKQEMKKPRKFATLIREVTVKDSIIFHGTFSSTINGKNAISFEQTKNSVPEIAFENNSIKLTFSALSYTNEKSNQFSCILKGFDKKWSDWNKASYKEYTNLPEGNYEFKVKSKNIFGIEGDIASYRFVILSPWYKKWWAYTLFVFIAALIVAVLIKLNTYRLQKENERLERLVSKRTAEIKAQHEEIKSQAEHLKKANTEIENKNIELKEQNDEIFTQNEEIRQQNEEILTQQEELNTYKNHLEEIVELRTKELLISKEKAEESDRLKTAFLENISHEIRTPMNAILGYTDLLATQDDQYDKELKIITSNFNQLLRTIDNIISLSKLHTKQFEVNKNEVFVEALFIELKAYMRREIKKKNTEIDFNYFIEDDNLSITGDFNALYFMFKHLLDNALKYTEKGKIILTARSINDNVEIGVKDTGMGIDKEKLPYIFDLFRKLENKNKTFRGTGAGLAIVKNIVELHNAEIKVSSSQGKETKFIVIFKALQ